MAPACQAVVDFETALGSKALAQQAMANIGTVVQFRAADRSSADSFSDLSAECNVKWVGESESFDPSFFASGHQSVSDFRATFGKHTSQSMQALVPPSAVLNLPRHSFFARMEEGLYLGRAPLLELN